MQSEPFVVCNNLVKIYKVADLEVVALQGLDLQVRKGEMIALVGASGSGKSTLLNVIGGLDLPNAGEIRVGDHDLLSMDNRRRERYKRDVVGFLWQQPGRNLLPYLSAIENIEMPMMLADKMSAKKKRIHALELLDILGLGDRSQFRPDQLSGGEQQRVALAVALANNPHLLLADEPTGSWIPKEPVRFSKPCANSTRPSTQQSSSRPTTLGLRHALIGLSASEMGGPARRSAERATTKTAACKRMNGLSWIKPDDCSCHRFMWIHS